MKELETITMDAEKSPLDRNQKIKLRAAVEARKLDLSNQLAFYQLGISRYQKEEELCEIYGVSKEQLERFKISHRDNIEKVMDEHRYGRFGIIKSIGKRAMLADAMADARIAGDHELADRISKVLSELDRVMPTSDLQQMAETLKALDESKPADAGRGGNTVNIMMSPALEAAQAALEERRRTRILEEKKK